MTEAPDPRGAYEARRAARQAVVDVADRRDARIANARLAVAIAAIGVLFMVLGPPGIRWTWLLVPAGIYAVLALVHDRVLRGRARAARGVAFYDRGLARVDDTWAGGGTKGERFEDPHHPYAADLDLFGEGSLFELLCLARTAEGEATLAAWLRAPASTRTIAARQEAVRELTGRLDLREDLALLGDAVRAEIEADVLREWGAAPARLGGVLLQVGAAILSTLAVAALVLWFAGRVGPTPFLVVALGIGFLGYAVRGRVAEVVGAVDRAGASLKVLAGILGRVEREGLASERFASLAGAGENAPSPSEEIARLGRIVDLLDARRNQFFVPIAWVLMWSLQLAHSVERWRRRSGPHVAAWIAAAGEVEALSSLSAYAFEHPDDPFPEITDGPPRFEADGLGHPLLPARTMVRNDVHLGKAPRALVVSGSNMSGKSTLLRSVGTATVLALAGAPVRARRLVLSPLAVGATLRIQDSLMEGASRFYAEITRLKQVMDLCESELPVLFLLDEVLHGTNSHDRRLGAEAILRGLVDRGAVGLVTTHDLALARTAETLGELVRNVHFEDHVEDGRITFDYVMHDGVVEKSNALELMRAVGLEV